MRDETQRFEEYAVVVAKAFSAIRASFPGLSLDNRLMIITPDEEFRNSLEPCLKAALRASGGGPAIKLVSAQEASATFSVEMEHTHSVEEEGERIVLTSISAADGLERLAVILVGLDVPNEEKKDAGGAEETKEGGANDLTRSIIYRGLTRAQMLVTVVNEHVPGGYFEWTNNVVLDKQKDFDQEEEKELREQKARKRCEETLAREAAKQPPSMNGLSDAITRANGFRHIPSVAARLVAAEQQLTPLVAQGLARGVEAKGESLLVEAIGAAEAVPAAAAAEAGFHDALVAARECLREVQEQAAVNELDAAMSPAKPDPLALERAIRKAERFGLPGLSKAKDLLIDWQDAAAVSALRSAKDAQDIRSLERAIRGASALKRTISDPELLLQATRDLESLQLPILEAALEAALASNEVDVLSATVSDAARFGPMVAKRKQIVEAASERLRELVIEALEASMQAGESEALARALGQARRVPRSASRPKFDEALQRAEQALRSLTERAERTAQQIWDTAGSVGAVVSATKLTFDPMSQGEEEAGAAAEEVKVSDVYFMI